MTDYNPTDDSTSGTDPLRELGLDGVILAINDGDCPCGCETQPKGKKSVFAMGHDARLKGKLIRAHLNGVPIHAVHFTDSGYKRDATQSAMEVAEDLGWAHVLQAAWDRQNDDMAERVAKAERGVLARAMATRDAEREGKLSEGDRRLIRVGRWEYTGTVVAIYESDGEVEYEYVTKGGETRTVRQPAEDAVGEVGA